LYLQRAIVIFVSYMRKNILFFIVIISILNYCKEDSSRKKTLVTKKIRQYKLSIKEVEEIKDLIENKKKFSLGILLKVKSANLDLDDAPERVVAYRKNGIEGIVALDLDRNNEYKLVKPNFAPKIGWQIITFNLESITNQLYDSIVVQIRPKNINRLKEIYYQVMDKSTNLQGLKLILDSEQLIRQGRLSKELPLQTIGSFEQTFANDTKTSQLNFILTAKVYDVNRAIREINKYYFFDGNKFSIKEETVEKKPEDKVQKKGVLQPKIIYKVQQNFKVQKKIKSSCQMIFDQVIQQCKREVENEDIDPDTDCMNKATSAKLTCYQG